MITRRIEYTGELHVHMLTISLRTIFVFEMTSEGRSIESHAQKYNAPHILMKSERISEAFAFSIYCKVSNMSYVYCRVLVMLGMKFEASLDCTAVCRFSILNRSRFRFRSSRREQTRSSRETANSDWRESNYWIEQGCQNRGSRAPRGSLRGFGGLARLKFLKNGAL